MATSHTNQSRPTADDLIFLLSLVGDHNSFIADQQQQQQSSSSSVHQSKKSSGDKSAWQQSLVSLPKQRRDIILSLKRLATARRKWHSLSANDINDGIQLQQLQNEEASDVLEEVEDVASTIRSYCTEYIQSIKEYILALQKCWHRPPSVLQHMQQASNEQNNYSQLANIGYQLSTQLINQLQWDEKLCKTILTFLNEELYQDISTTNNASNDKLLVWSEAMLKMIKIDKSLWNFVEREVYDETLLELDDDQEPPEYLNGECSTQYVNIEPSSEQLMEKSGSVQENETEDEANLHERIVSSASLEEAVETFIQCNTSCRGDTNKCLTSILLVGEEGCGKTHLLNTIQQQYSSSNDDEVKILRPNYQVDLVGNSIGSTEDRLIALFTYATRYISSCTGRSRRSRKCIIMLDDIDQMFALSNDITNDSSSDSGYSSTQYYIKRRCKALFITILDALKEHYMHNNNNGHLLLLCTSRSKCLEVVDRFDRTFHRGQPDEKERYQLITSCLSQGGDYTVDNSQDDNVEELISLIVHHSAGRSVFELSQFCRETILRCTEAPSTKEESIFKHRLECLDKLLQTKSPQSVRGGSLDGVVDMRVFTPEELQSKLTTDSNGDVHFPLLGAEAKRAHESLMNVVITPLCRSDEIRALLYGGGDSQQSAIVNAKPIRVGALLAGAPGVGKTALAYHCAALAAKMSRVSLLDVSCTSLIHKEIGGSERAVQRLFTAVRAAAPCIVLLDGIESVALKRGNDNTTEGTMDRVLSTFLTELDGIETGSEGDGATSGNVAVIGITHNPDLIDPSLLRPGRLEKTITLGAPDYNARLELVKRQIEHVDFDFSSAGYFDAKTKDDISNFVAMSSAGMSAVEVIAICREASMVCLRELNFEATEKPLLRHEHFKVAMKGRSSN